MKESLRISIVMLALMTLLTGVVYPLVVTVVAQIVFPDQANGSLVMRNGKPIGSSLIGQPFSGSGYFWSRPSATASIPYNAAASGGSNLGPLNPDLAKNARSRIDDLRRFDSDIKTVPVDLVTASASGLDPHISPAAAEIQVRRVAAARGRSENEVRELVRRHTEGRQFGVLGESRVNVLRLNLAIDGAEPPQRSSAWRIPLPTRETFPTVEPDSLRTNLNLWKMLSNTQKPKITAGELQEMRSTIGPTVNRTGIESE